MTKDDIIRMAREACGGKTPDGWGVMFDHDQLERFVALVEAHIREKVARWQIGSGYSTGHGDTIEDLLVELEWQVRESEREACASIEVHLTTPVRDYTDISPLDAYEAALMDAAMAFRESIRARGKG